METKIAIPTVELFTDGSSKGNPGPSGFAYIIKYFTIDDNMSKEILIKESRGYNLSTNNRMEIMAILFGLQHILELNSKIKSENKIKQVNVYTDSQYASNSISQGWIYKWEKNNWLTADKKDVKNKDLWKAIINTINHCRDQNIRLFITHITGHNGIELNEVADKLCSEATKSDNKFDDKEYTNSIQK